MEQYMIWVWLGVVVLSFILEAITQDYVSVWFSIGGLITLCVCNFIPWWAEIIVFVAVSVAALVGTRPFIKKVLKTTVRKTNTDDFIGKRVKAVTDITKFDAGEVKINGIIYTAILLEDEQKTIKEDSIVEIVALKGNRVVVKEIEIDK